MQEERKNTRILDSTIPDANLMVIKIVIDKGGRLIGPTHPQKHIINDNGTITVRLSKK